MAGSHHQRLRWPRVQATQGTERGSEGDLIQVLIGVGDQGEQPDSGAAKAQADCTSVDCNITEREEGR
jgi:hypothetical protein